MVNFDESIRLLGLKGDKKDRCETGVSDNDQDHVVETGLPPIVHRDDKVLQLEQIP